MITTFSTPDVPGLSDGRGLDLRGIILILGSWLGGLLTGLGGVLSFAISQAIHKRRKQKIAKDETLIHE